MDKVFDRGLRAFVTPPAGSAAAYPVTLGYEMVSEVVEVAPDVTAMKVGDLVHTGTPHQEETVLDVEPVAGDHVPAGGPADRRAARAGAVHLAVRRGAAGRARRGDQARRLGERARDGRHRADGHPDVPAGGHPERVRDRPGPAPARARREVRGDGRARPDRGRARRPAGPGPQPRTRCGRGDRRVRLGPGPAGGAGGRGAERDGGRGRLLPGRGGPPASRRGVPPQSPVPDRVHRRVGDPEPARAAVGPPPGTGRRDPPALHGPRLRGGPARPERPVRPGARGVREARRAPAGGREGRARLRPGSR